MNLLKKSLLAITLTMALSTVSADIPPTGSGTVAETIDVDSYTYIRLAENGNWVAAAPTVIRVGDKVSYADGALMKNFTSRTLGRTFDEILFVARLNVTAAAPEDHDPEALVQHAHEAVEASAARVPESGEIEPAEGGMTIAEIHAGYQLLNGQNVTVRGRVMKFSEKILGTNWVTLNDGSGTAPDDKLVAKTDQVVSVGDEVTVEGTVATDVNLGIGYDYKVLLEDARILR